MSFDQIKFMKEAILSDLKRFNLISEGEIMMDPVKRRGHTGQIDIVSNETLTQSAENDVNNAAERELAITTFVLTPKLERQVGRK